MPASYGGFETFADRFAQEHDRETLDLVVFCDASIDRGYGYTFCTRKFLPLSANGAQGVLYDILAMLICCLQRRNVLLLGCSGGMAVPFCRVLGLKVVTNIAGLEWSRSKWGYLARKFLKLSEQIAIRHSSAVIVDNQGLNDYLLKEYGASAQVIPYGGDRKGALAATQWPKRFSDKGLVKGEYFLGIARCQPDNNVAAILDACAQSNSYIAFISNWKISDYGRQLEEKYEKYPNIILIDPIYDDESLGLLRENCKAYIHGHSAGGTNPALVEAMWSQVNCYCFDNIFNRYTTFSHAKFWRDTSELTGLLNLDVRRYDMVKERQALFETAMKQYRWSNIVRKYSELLKQVIQ